MKFQARIFVLHFALQVCGISSAFCADQSIAVSLQQDIKVGEAVVQFSKNLPGRQTTAAVLYQQKSGFPEVWKKELAKFEQRMGRPLLDPARNYVLLVTTTPSKVFDFRSGEHLRKSLNKNMPGVKTVIGHSMLAWQCSNGQSVTAQSVGAVTGEADDQLLSMVSNGWGLTPYVSAFTDGIFQSAFQFDEMFNDTFLPRRRPMQTLVLEVAPEQCQKVKNFVQSFITHQNRPYRLFGSTLSPRKFEGGGCVSFVKEALDAGGIIKNIRDHFVRRFNLPYRALGRGDIDERGQPLGIKDTFVHAEILKATKKSMSIDQLFNLNWNPQGNEPYFTFDQVDVELVQLSYRYFNEQALEVLRSNGVAIPEAFRKNVVLPRKIESLDLHMNPILGVNGETFVSHYKENPIERGYDENEGNQANLLYDSIDQYFRENKSRMGVEFFNFFHSYGLKIELSR